MHLMLPNSAHYKAYKHRHENPDIYKCEKYDLRKAIVNNKRKCTDKLKNIFQSSFDRDNDTVPVSEPIEEGTPPPLTISEHETRYVRCCFHRVKAGLPENCHLTFKKLLKT